MEGESLLKYLVGFEVVVVGVPPELRVQGSVNQGATPKQGGAAPQNISCKEVWFDFMNSSTGLQGQYDS